MKDNEMQLLAQQAAIIHQLRQCWDEDDLSWLERAELVSELRALREPISEAYGYLNDMYGLWKEMGKFL